MKTNLISDCKQSIVAAERTCSISHTWRILCATITLLLTLGVGNVWGYEFTGGYIYFDNSVANQSGVIQLCARQGSYTAVTTLNNIENTKLYYNGSCTGTDWGGYSGIFIIANDAAWNNGDFAETNGSLRWHTAWEGSYECKSGNTTLFAPTSSSNGTAANPTYIGNSATSYTSLNYTQTIKSQVSTNGGSTYSDANSKATISVTSYKLTGNGAVTKQTASVSTSAKNTTVSAARTATTTVSIGAVATGFTFVGWYDGSTQVSTESSYTYYPTAAKTITAKFKNETTYAITIANSVNATTSTVNVGATPVQITAPEIAGYRFSTWNTMPSGVTKTSGNLTDQSIYISATQAATVTATYVAKTPVRLYFSNPDGWATVKAYVWKNATTVTDKNADWPGVAITTNTVVNNCNTFYYYEYYKEDHPDWNRVIFNDGGSNKTSDITFSNTTNNGQYYVGSSWTSTPGSRWALAHSIDSYNTTTHPLTCASTTSGSVDVVLAGNTEYQFKFVDTYTNTWYGVTSPTKITYTNKGTAQTMNNTGSSSNQTMTSAGAGTYRFTWNITNKKVTITYPTSYTVEFEVGTVKGNVNNPIIYHTSVDNANKVTSGKYVAEGTKVIFWIANSAGTAPKAGYNWWGFYNNAAGTGSNLPEKYTDNTVSVYNINSISANAHVYAVFGENDYTVKMYNNGNGDVYEGGSIVTSTTAHVATASNTLTATPQTGYYFTGWDQFSDSLTINSPSTASTTIKIKSNKLGNNARLRANYSPQWSVIGTGAFGGWSAYGSHLFTGYTVVSTKNVGYHSITLAANTSYEIKVYDRQNSTAYGGSAAQTIDYAHSGAGNQYTVATTASPKNVVIQSAAGGTYTLNWNLTDKKIAVVYPTSWFITSGQKTEGQSDEAGGSFTAVDNSSNDVKGGKFVADNASVTFSATPNTGYDFDGWYTNAGCTEGKNSTNPMTVSSITANKTIYAKFVPKTYTVTLTQTGAASAGTASVTASYNADAPTIATLPTAANGYAFMGYYSATDGEGTQFVQANGTWNDVTSYISGGKWIYDDGVELFAYFKKAEISISLSSTTVEKNATVTATPTLDPVPEGEMAICWELQYNNTNLYCNDCFTPASGNSVTFEAPGISGTFIVKATLRNATCDGEEIDNTTTNLTVAGNHTVTIRYMGDGSQLQASTEMTAAPLVWSNEITAPDIFGYTFAGWTAGDGITITDDNGTTSGTSSSSATIKLQATYEGTLTANYVETPIVYFYNNLGWSEVYVTYDAYWTETNTGDGEGTGNWGKPYHKMTRIEGTNIWYDAIPATYTSSGFSGWAHNIAFNSQPLGNVGESSGYKHFNKGNVIFRRDFDPYNTMFVPATTDVVATYTKNGATYYSSTITYYDNRNENNEVTSRDYYYNGGYWKKYNSTYSGYSLRGTFAGVIGNETNWSGEEHNLYSETAEETAEGWVTTTSLPLNGNCNYDFRIYRNHLKNDCSSAYTNYGTMTISNHTNWRFETRQDWRSNNCTLKAATPGVYTFKVVFDKQGRIYVTVDYPMYAGDYRLLYKDDDHNLWHPSEAIHPGNEQDIVSFFSRTADKHPTLKWQYSTAISSTGTITWSTPADISLTGWVGAGKAISENGVYNFILNYNASTHALTLADVKPYTGNYYIRTDCTGKNKWENYKNDPDHTMTYSEYSFSQETHPYSHYYTHWVDKDKDGGAYKNVKFVIANDYSPCISDTMTREEATGEWANIASYIDASGNLKRNANVRFMWNQSTNEISRAYIDGAQGTGSNIFLRLLSDDGKVYDLSDPAQVQASTAFTDNQNWIYEANVKANPNAQIRLLSTWGTTNTIQQYFKGTAAGGTETLIGGAGDTKFRIRLLYDFKTNRLVAAWLPDGEITETQEIEADVMIVRDHQNEGQTITFTEGAELQKVQTVYGAMKFNRWTLNNKSTATGHAVLPVAEQKSIYERSLYFISFPFDVKVSEIFGFGHYWDEWYIEYYDGLNRAKNGYWKDSEPNWKYVTPEMAKTYVLKANEGYILGLDLDYMADDNTTFWAHGIESVELFFPSTVDMETLQSTSFTMPALNEEYECKINRGTATGDRRVKDSYWRCIGVPGFSNYNSVLTKGKGGDDIQWQTNTEWRADFKDYPFLYSWNMTDNTLTAQSTKNFNFQCMHAYLVQNGNEIHWTAVSTKPSPIVRRSSAEANTLREYNWRLTLERNGETEDQTFVRMSNEENITDGFDFGQDLAKEENYGRSDIYTFIGYEHAAANSMPLHTGETTIVPVGVNVEKAGEYTFAMPEGTDGVGITLVDSETGTRTNLSAGLTYTLTLDKAEYTNRLHLEISPVKEVATGNDNIQSDDVQRTRKLLIDGILYIVKDGKVYTAQGQKAN